MIINWISQDENKSVPDCAIFFSHAFAQYILGYTNEPFKVCN